MSVELNNWSNTLNIRCVVPCCECKSFKPGSIFLRQCECCRHSWVAHVLAKLNPLPLFPCNIEGLSGAIAYDIASMILFGTHAIPVKLKILLDRIIPSHIQTDINRILHIFGWNFQDYSRGYILIDNMGQAREHWNICTSEEEPVILQQFLRFYETRAMAYDMLLKEYSRNSAPNSTNDLPVSSLTSPSNIGQNSESSPLLFPSSRNTVPTISSVTSSSTTNSGMEAIKSLPNNRIAPPPISFPSNPPAPFPLLPLLPGGAGGAAALASFLSNAGGNKPASIAAQMSSYLGQNNPLEAFGLNEMKMSDQMEKNSEMKARTEMSAKMKYPVNPSRDEPANKKQRFRASGGNSDQKSITIPMPRKPVNRTLSTKSDSMNSRINDDESTRTGSPLSSVSEQPSENKKEDLDDSRDKNANNLINGIGRTKKRVLCTTCNKTFCDKGALKIHYSAVHLQEMHKCTMKGCNMWFSSRRSRNRHSANPNPRLHMSQSNKKLPDNAIIVDDGTGRPLGDRLPIPPSVLNPPTVPATEETSELQSYHSRPQATSSPLTSPISPSYSRICAPLFNVPSAKVSLDQNDLRSPSRSSSTSDNNSEMDICEPINLVLSKSSMQEIDDTDGEQPEGSDNNKFFNKENEKDSGRNYSLTVKTDDSSSPPMLLSRGDDEEEEGDQEDQDDSRVSESDDVLRDVMMNSVPSHHLSCREKFATRAQS